MDTQEELQVGSSNNDNEIPPLHLEKAIQRTLGDTGFLEMMLNQFLEEMPTKIQELKDALGQNDHTNIERKAHSLKGAAANLSADRIAAVALKLERLGREQNLDDGQAAISRLEDESEKLKNFVEQIKW